METSTANIVNNCNIERICFRKVLQIDYSSVNRRIGFAIDAK